MLSLEIKGELKAEPVMAFWRATTDGDCLKLTHCPVTELPCSEQRQQTHQQQHHQQQQQQKTPRKSTARRNERERNRVKHINSTFSILRQHLPPSHGCTTKMSKVDTLRNAIDYIKQLQQMLAGERGDQRTGEPCAPGLMKRSGSQASFGSDYDLQTSPEREHENYPDSVSSIASSGSPGMDMTGSSPHYYQTDTYFSEDGPLLIKKETPGWL